MNNFNPIKTVIKFEVMRQIKKPSFWISLILMPLFIIGLYSLSIINNSNSLNSTSSSSIEKTLGLTDESKIIENNSKFKIFSNKEEGITAVKDGKIDIFYYIPSNFVNNPVIDFYTKPSKLELFSLDDKYIKEALTEVATKSTTPVNLTILNKAYTTNLTTFNNAGKEINMIGQAIVPIAILAIFYILICVFGNRLLMSVVEEKENRISEMILTAISAKNLIIGKIIALIILGFIQISIFIIPLISLLIINLNNPAIELIIKSIELNPITILANILLLLFSYFLFTGFSTFIGSMMPTARDASQYFSIIIIGIISPFFFINSFIAAEPSTISYVMSYFPLSAPLALMLRNAAGTLPWYELLAGVGALAFYSLITLHLAVKSFQKNAINFSIVKPSFKLRTSWKKIKN